jgi:hypothetical protein
MLHAKAMAVVVAYDIYIELAEGKVDLDWKVDKPLDFYTFRETLARQMLSYTPKDVKYLGDELFRLVTQSTKAKRAPSPPLPALIAEGAITTTAAGINGTVLVTKKAKKRLCGFVGNLAEHYDSCNTMEEKGKKLTCVFCGKPTYQFCGLCGSAMHKYPQDDGQSSCFFHWHDTGCFGLARDDWKITNKRMKEWKYPTMAEMKANEQQMMQLSKQVSAANGNGSNGNGSNGNGGNTSDSDSD